MSPQETSEWCSSLALCGVRGACLRELQQHIMRRGLDGAGFDRMLRNNQLMEIGIEDLNPRLALAIRRSWTTDFGSVSWIDYGSQQHVWQAGVKQQAQLMQQTQQQSSQYRGRDQAQYQEQEPVGGGGGTYVRSRGASNADFGGPRQSPNLFEDSRHGDPRDPYGAGGSDRLGGRGGGDPRDYGGFGGSGGGRGGGDPDWAPNGGGPGGYRRGPDGFQDQPEAYPDQRTQMLHGGGHPTYAGGMQDWDGPHMQQPPAFASGGMMGSPQGRGGMGGMSSGGAGGMAYGHPDQPPQDHRGRQRPSSGHPSGGGQEDAFPPGGARPGSRGGAAFGQYDAPGMFDQQPPAAAAAPTVNRGRGRVDPNRGDQWGEGGLESVMPKRPPAPRGGLDYSKPVEAVPRTPQQTRRAADVMEHWGEGGLDAVMPPRDRATHQPYMQAANRERDREAMLETQARARQGAPDRHSSGMDWGGESLGDVLSSNKTSRFSNQGSYARQERPEEVDDRFREPPPMPPMAQQRPSPGGGGGGFGGGGGGMGPFGAGRDEEFAAPPSGHAQHVRERQIDTRDYEPPPPQPQQESPPQPRERPRSRPSAAALAEQDNGWGGQSLGDALAPKKKAPQDGGLSAGGAGGGGGGGGGGGAGGRRAPPAASDQPDCGKSCEEIITWVRSLPESHVPEKSRENIACMLEEQRLTSREFTNFVQTVAPEVCAPKHAMKLRTAWNNVLAETAAKAVARDNFLNAPKQKATMIVV
eukprot:gnl/TRDRNA2_/TRDRNA2_154728_c0_seq3.p1 gnl/TRDRNA2_/TRDRNA2_154728_c0~~gnl/TRDRNA2_/TRDRNA2_154728_c0_seq3.p1  ORF type:complete len:794 (+),score=130.04 gnl/TRDRNA2_/TRDRNA2_154728_c0_seq3:138-2384(+)